MSDPMIGFGGFFPRVTTEFQNEEDIGASGLYACWVSDKQYKDLPMDGFESACKDAFIENWAPVEMEDFGSFILSPALTPFVNQADYDPETFNGESDKIADYLGFAHFLGDDGPYGPAHDIFADQRLFCDSKGFARFPELSDADKADFLFGRALPNAGDYPVAFFDPAGQPMIPTGFKDQLPDPGENHVSLIYMEDDDGRHFLQA